MFGGSRKENYQQLIDGEDEEQPADDGGSVPPSLHEIVQVSFEGVGRDSEITTSSREHRWDHIEDIDQFFTLVYEYYQGHGFLCIALRHAFALFQFLFVVCFSTFLLQCVDYGVLFNDKNVTAAGTPIVGKRHIHDVIDGNCASHLHPLIVIALLLAAVCWVAHLIRVGYRLLQHYEIQTFFTTVLEIPDRDLSNFSWREVVTRICKVQPQLHLIINQEEITPLDVYQRILRYKNYTIGMVYKNVMPPQIYVPFIGQVPYFSSGLRLNLDWLLFWSPWSPWKGPYALRDEYKTGENLDVFAEKLRRTILWMGIANLIFFPFIFIYQVLFSFFSYAELVKREPDVFGTRRYSNYARLKFRHFNELDHELRLRLSRSYEYAARYVDQFTSPTAEIVAKTVAFTCGSVAAVVVLLTLWDEDVINIEHMLTVGAVCGTIVVACRSFIPKENLVYCQDFLMRQVVANVHYAPDSWLSEAHSSTVAKEFGQLFQLKAHYLVEELLSPILTPLVLIFSVSPKASDIVMFFHEHTSSIVGVGDICSFAVMDVKKDGDMRLAELNNSSTQSATPRHSMKYATTKSGSGKVELSLLNFVTLHPEWRPPAEAMALIQNVREKLAKDAIQNPQQHAIMRESLHELARSIMGAPSGLGTLPMASSVMQNIPETETDELAALETLSSTNPDAPPSSFSAAVPSARSNRSGSTTSIGTANATSSTTHRSGLAGITQSSEKNEPEMASSSLFYPMPFSNVQPVNIRERNAQAMEMSMNALLVNRMLMSSSTTHRLPNTYGSTTMAANPVNQQSRYPMNAQSRFGATSTAASNIWGVPDQSHFRPNDSMYGSDNGLGF